MGKERTKKKEDHEGGDDMPVPPPPPAIGDDFAMPAKEIRVPDNQLHLTEHQLDEEIAKMLTANNPEAPKALTRFNQKEHAYKAEAMIEQTMTHYTADGWLLHRESEDAKKQADQQKYEKDAQARFQAEVDRAQAESSKDADTLDNSKELRNQFNFSERAAQTSSLHPKDKETMTEPPPTLAISGTCCQSAIYDEYIKDQERLEQGERMAKAKAAAKKGNVAKEDPGVIKEQRQEEPDALATPELGLAAKVVERMVNQNTFDDIAMDFKYWDDASDQFKASEGTLLPLWKFYNERARKKAVTAIAWSPMVRHF